MVIERLVYNNRLARIPSFIEGLIDWRPSNAWQDSNLKQKMLVSLMGLVLMFGLGHVLIGGVKASQANFLSHLDAKSASSGVSSQMPIPAATSQMPAAIPAFADLNVEGSDLQVLARGLSAQKFGDQDWSSLLKLWNAESGWNPNARNGSSGACGIPQAVPCHKIPDLSEEGQINWGLDYIAKRYGNPTNAWRFWQSHHWY